MESLIRMAAFTGGESAPAARFRLRQYIPALSASGIETTEYASRVGNYPPRGLLRRVRWGMKALAERVPAVIRSHRQDVAFLQRELLSTLITLEPLIAAPRILD